MAWDETGNPPGSLYRLTPDGTVTELFGDVGLSNGLDWTDDRRLFYYADSTSGRVDLFDTDPGHRRAVWPAPLRDRPPEPTAIPTASPSTPRAASGWPSGTPANCAATPPTAAWTPWSASPPARSPPPPSAAPTSAPSTSPPPARATPPPTGAEQPHAGDIFACTPGVPGRLPFLFGQTP